MLAQLPPYKHPQVGTSPAPPAELSDLEAVFARLLYYVIGFAAIAVFIMFLLGGFKWLTSAGNPKNVEAARNTLTYAVVGLVVILLSYLILVLINTITGAPVLNFSVLIP